MTATFLNHRPWSGLLASIAIHAFVLGGILLTFPDSEYPVKPYLIFLGSFLNDQDMSFSLPLSGSQINPDSGSIRLDMRRDAYSHTVNKPEQRSLGGLFGKLQFKPVMASDSPVEDREKKSKDLEGEFGTVSPVRMKLVPDDNH